MIIKIIIQIINNLQQTSGLCVLTADRAGRRCGTTCWKDLSFISIFDFDSVQQFAFRGMCGCQSSLDVRYESNLDWGLSLMCGQIKTVNVFGDKSRCCLLRTEIISRIDPETVCWSTQTKQWWQWWWSIGGIVCGWGDRLMTMTMIGKTWSRYCLLVRDLTSTSFPLESSFAISGTSSPRHTSTDTMRQFSQNIQGLMFPNRERVKDFKSFCSSTRWSLSQTLTHTWVQNIIGSTACRAISYSMIVFLALAKLMPWQNSSAACWGQFCQC